MANPRIFYYRQGTSDKLWVVFPYRAGSLQQVPTELWQRAHGRADFRDGQSRPLNVTTSAPLDTLSCEAEIAKKLNKGYIEQPLWSFDVSALRVLQNGAMPESTPVVSPLGQSSGGRLPVSFYWKLEPSMAKRMGLLHAHLADLEGRLSAAEGLSHLEADFSALPVVDDLRRDRIRGSVPYHAGPLGLAVLVSLKRLGRFDVVDERGDTVRCDRFSDYSEHLEATARALSGHSASSYQKEWEGLFDPEGWRALCVTLSAMDEPIVLSSIEADRPSAYF